MIKERLRFFNLVFLCLFIAVWAIAVIGWPLCIFNVDETCPDPKYPHLHVEKGNHERGDIYWCLPDSRSDTSRRPAVEVKRVCDAERDWMWTFVFSLCGWVVFGAIWLLDLAYCRSDNPCVCCNQ